MAVINGTSGADTLADTSGNDTINGLAGNDTINGGNGGTDVVNGGDGRDSLQFMTATSAVVVDFVAGTGGHIPASRTSKRWSPAISTTGSPATPRRRTSPRAPEPTRSRAAGGIDTLWGGAGADTFIFRETGTANADSIGDWTSGSDTLLLDGAVMTALGASGDFTAGDARFWASSTRHGARRRRPHHLQQHHAPDLLRRRRQRLGRGAAHRHAADRRDARRDRHRRRGRQRPGDRSSGTGATTRSSARTATTRSTGWAATTRYSATAGQTCCAATGRSLRARKRATSRKTRRNRPLTTKATCRRRPPRVADALERAGDHDHRHRPLARVPVVADVDRAPDTSRLPRLSPGPGARGPPRSGT